MDRWGVCAERDGHVFAKLVFTRAMIYQTRYLNQCGEKGVQGKATRTSWLESSSPSAERRTLRRCVVKIPTLIPVAGRLIPRTCGEENVC
jgi:hypothetical protein